MITESYNYINIRDKIEYLFASRGEQGRIAKLVSFTHVEDDDELWNLAFGDMINGQMNDSVISNNHDIVKIIGTVAKIAYEFSTEFPLRRIRIKPVDDKRKKLYNHVFRRHYAFINDNFHIVGSFEGQKEAYSPEKVYDFFELKRKFI
jgi:hypothetical protein